MYLNMNCKLDHPLFRQGRPSGDMDFLGLEVPNSCKAYQIIKCGKVNASSALNVSTCFKRGEVEGKDHIVYSSSVLACIFDT